MFTLRMNTWLHVWRIQLYIQFFVIYKNAARQRPFKQIPIGFPFLSPGFSHIQMRMWCDKDNSYSYYFGHCQLC